MNNYDSLERLSNIFTLLATPQEDATLENISDTLDIPISVVKQDIQTLFRNEVFEANSVRDDKSSQLGLYSSGFSFSYDTTPIFVTNYEKTLLDKYFPSFTNNNSISKPYLIKESPAVCSNSYEQLCERIQLAIDNHYCVKFTYRSRSKKQLLNLIVEPHLLYHNINNGRLYLISLKGKVHAYRLDLILSLIELPQEKFSPDYSEDHLRLFDYLWGMDLSSTESPYHIKLKINAYNKNILDKIRNDVSRRKYAKLYQAGEYWYYEDEIIGISAFRTWVYQFGYSVLVQSPEILAREIYNSALHKLENYSQNCFTHK